MDVITALLVQHVRFVNQDILRSIFISLNLNLNLVPTQIVQNVRLAAANAPLLLLIAQNAKINITYLRRLAQNVQNHVILAQY